MLQVDFGERSQGSLSEFLGSGKDGQLGLPGRIPPHPLLCTRSGTWKILKAPCFPFSPAEMSWLPEQSCHLESWVLPASYHTVGPGDLLSFRGCVRGRF